MKFYNGMKRDTARIDQPQDSYRRARNIILDHTLAAVKSEGGLDDLIPNSRQTTDYNFADYPNIDVCGIIPLPQDQHLYIMRTGDGDNHLVHVKSLEYSLIATITDGPYTPQNPIKGVAYERPSGDYVVAWTDGANNPVYTIIDNPDIQTTATIYPLFPTPTFPNCIGRRKNWATAGSIGVGTYSFFIAYEIDDDNITPFSPSYGTFKIGVGSDDRLVKAQIEFRLENLDTSYNTYRIYGIRNLNETLTSFYIKSQSTQESIVTWSGEITNYDISINALTIPSAWYETAETLTVADDRLYLANLTTINFDGSSIADNVNLHWSIESSSRYENAPLFIDNKELQWTAQYRRISVNAIDRDQVSALPDHYGTSMGFMPGCAYAFYIAFLLKDGNWTQAYPIPGTVGDATVETIVDAVGDVVWPRANTLGERYMGDLGGVANLSGDVVHVMPTPAQVAEAWGAQVTAESSPNNSNQHYDQRFAATDIGVLATNIIIPEADRDLVQGYSLFYAKPNANSRTILAYTPEAPAQYHFVAADGEHNTANNGYSVRDAYLNDLQPDLNGCRRKYIYADQGANADGYDMSTATDGSVGSFQYEYLPGNTNGLIFSTDNREGKLIIEDDAVHPTLDSGQVPPDAFGLENSLEEVWGWSWSEDYNSYMDWLRARPKLLYAIERPSPPEFYNDLDNQQLVRCSYIEQDLTRNDMDRVSWGGDTVASPMRYRYIEAARVHTMDASGQVPTNFLNWSFYNQGQSPSVYTGATAGEWQLGDPFADGTHINFLTPRLFNYMTYQYVIQGNEDMSNPNLLLEEQIDIYAANNVAYWTTDQFNEGLARYAGSPEEANVYSSPRHLFQLNDHKSAFPSSRTEFIYRYPNRIARSSKQNYESNTVQWSQFAPGDRYDNALNKGPIQNIAEYAGEIIIHHTDSIFKTLGKETLDTSASAVFVGSSDLFRAAPAELIPTEEGYAGIVKHTDAMVCKSGYVFVDSAAGKVFQLSSNLEELSQKGMRLYFRNTFNHTGATNYSPYAGNGYSLGYDPVYDRILITAHAGSNYETISYSALNDCWASNHTYRMYGYSTDRAAVFGWTGTTLSRIDVDGAAANGCYIELISNEGGSISKVFQNFEWVTKLRNVDTDSVGTWQQGTFDSAFVYNDTGLSANTALANNARFVEEMWRFNDFRNMTDAAEEWFDEDGNVIATINTTKPWYQQQRIRGGYAGIRLILLPTNDNVLYLTEVTAKYRVSYR